MLLTEQYTQKERLTLMTCLRKCIASEEEFDIKAAVTETNILQILITAVYGWPQSSLKIEQAE